MPEFWHCDRIEDTSRIVYDNPRSHLKLEILKIDGVETAFVFLDQHRFSSGEIELKIDEEVIKEKGTLRQGNMRIKLSPETTQKIILALHHGQKIDILKEEILASSFEKAYGAKKLIFNLRSPLE